MAKRKEKGIVGDLALAGILLFAIWIGWEAAKLFYIVFKNIGVVQ